MVLAADAPGWIRGIENPYIQGAFAPVEGELTLEELPVQGELPRDLNGTYVRNGPNAARAPKRSYHWFDGDGMLHAISFRDGRASYRSRWVRTEGFRAEAEAERALWPGYMDPPDPDAPPGSGSDGWLKDSANTDVVFHAGSLLALWYQCGTPYRVDATTLEPLGIETFQGTLPRRVSAHAKVDERTGELIFFDYATEPPYIAYYVASPDGKVVHSVPIEVPGPRLPHDMAITEHYSILMDLPLFWDPELLRRGVHKVRFFDDLPSRFAILPRHGGADQVRWFEASPAYIYHVVNAWEEGDEIVMDACRTLDPCPSSDPTDGPLARMMAFLRLQARLERWRFNLRTGETREEVLDDRNMEFPSTRSELLGRPTHFSYHMSIAPERALLFDGLVKYDARSGRSESFAFGPGCYGSEAPFAPSSDAGEDGPEDEGYVLSYVTDASDGRSEVLVLDARNLAAGPLARVSLPTRVPLGFHACWVQC